MMVASKITSGSARRRGLGALVLVVLLASACGSGDTGDATGDGDENGPSASATGATTAIGDAAAGGADSRPESDDGTGSESDGESESEGEGESDGESEAQAAVDGDAAAPQTGAGIDCDTDCNIAMDGDSLTEGLGERLCLTVGTGNCLNSGVSGARVDQMIESARTDVDDQVGDGDNDVLILWGGTNDLWQAFHAEDPEANATAVYGQIALYLDERRAAGWDYTFVVTLPPMNDEQVKGRTILNDLIRTNASGADAIIDLDAEPRLADPFNIEFRQSDGIHFNALGANLVATDHLVPAIRSLDGS